MKAKLLREVRKRYTIYIYANGFDDGPFVNTKNYSLVLRDENLALVWYESTKVVNQLVIGYQPNVRLFYVGGSRYKTEKEVIQMLKDEMLKRILIAYKNKGVRRKRHLQKRTKVYYNENINIK